MNNQISGAFFDLGDTLVERQPKVDEDSIRELLAAAGPRRARQSDLSKWIRRLRKAERATWAALAHRLPRIVTLAAEEDFLREEFYPEVVRRLNLPPMPSDVLERLARRQMGPETYQCFPDVDETLIRAMGLGLKLGLISNALPSALLILEYLGLLDRFDVVVLSYQEGCLKPAGRIYKIALDRMEVDGASAVFVDDRPAFVTGAAEHAGMLGLLLDRNREHHYQRGATIRELGELFLVLEEQQRRAGPQQVAFGQLALDFFRGVGQAAARLSGHHREHGLAAATRLVQLLTLSTPF